MGKREIRHSDMSDLRILPSLDCKTNINYQPFLLLNAAKVKYIVLCSLKMFNTIINGLLDLGHV